MTRCAIRGRPTRSDQKTGHHPGSRCASWMRPINQLVGKICFFQWGPDRGAVNPEMSNAPMWLAKAKTMLVANGFRRSKDAARAGRSSRAAPNSLKTRIRDGTIGKTMPARSWQPFNAPATTRRVQRLTAWPQGSNLLPSSSVKHADGKACYGEQSEWMN